MTKQELLKAQKAYEAGRKFTVWKKSKASQGKHFGGKSRSIALLFPALHSSSGSSGVGND